METIQILSSVVGAVAVLFGVGWTVSTHNVNLSLKAVKDAIVASDKV